MEIIYDTPIKVDVFQLRRLREQWGGTFAWRYDGENHWIKVWMMKYAPEIKKILEA